MKYILHNSQSRPKYLPLEPCPTSYDLRAKIWPNLRSRYGPSNDQIATHNGLLNSKKLNFQQALLYFLNSKIIWGPNPAGIWELWIEVFFFLLKNQVCLTIALGHCVKWQMWKDCTIFYFKHTFLSYPTRIALHTFLLKIQMILS